MDTIWKLGLGQFSLHLLAEMIDILCLHLRTKTVVHAEHLLFSWSSGT
jgi:hypothetical protein